MSRAGH